MRSVAAAYPRLVADEGPGFRPAEVPDGAADENLDKPGGRGLLLMRHYMTRVAFNRAGNVVVLEMERRRRPEK